MDEYCIWDKHETHIIMCVHVCLCVMMSFWRVSHVRVWTYLMCVSYVHEWLYIWPIRTRHTWCEWAHIWADTHRIHVINEDIYDCIHVMNEDIYECIDMIWMRGWYEMMWCSVLLLWWCGVVSYSSVYRVNDMRWCRVLSYSSVYLVIQVMSRYRLVNESYESGDTDGISSMTTCTCHH